MLDDIAKIQQREQIKRWDEGEQKLRDSLELTVAARELSTDELECWSRFSAWCEQKSARALPAKPWVVATYILETAGMGVPSDQVLAVLKSGQLVHDKNNLNSPVYTTPALKALDAIVKVEPPRSFSQDEKADWHLVPPTIRDAISRVDQARNKELRRLQNETAELKKRYAATDEAVQTSIEERL